MSTIKIPPVLRPAVGGERQVYLNDEDVRTLDWLDTAVDGGATLTILPAMAGGH